MVSWKTLIPISQFLAAVTVPSPVRFSQIAKQTGISVKQLRASNPHLTRKMTPPSKKKTYSLWVPVENKEKLLASVDNLKSHRLKIKAPTSSGSRKYHRVRRGETLASISKRYGITIRHLKKINGMRSNRIYAGSRLKIRNNATVASNKKQKLQGPSRRQPLLNRQALQHDCK